MRDATLPGIASLDPGYASTLRRATSPNLPIFVAKSNVTGTARLH